MPANRRRHAITAPYDRWVLLGSRLELRRRALGHTWRTTFERDRGVNKRLAADIEKAPKDRVNRYMPGTMQLIAQGYAVTYESVTALLRSETDDLVPAPAAGPPGSPAPFAGPGLPPPPQSELIREAAVRPYADPIWIKLIELQKQGIADPDGAQLGLDPFYAREWDRSAGTMIMEDRVWLIGTLLRNAAAWNEDRQPGATSA